jgi:hypothetical protein
LPRAEADVESLQESAARRHINEGIAEKRRLLILMRHLRGNWVGIALYNRRSEWTCS